MKKFSIFCTSIIVILIAGCEKKTQVSQPKVAQVSVQNTAAQLQEPNDRQTPREITLAAQGLASIIQRKSPELLDSITGMSGIVLIRNFSSGTYGARGENIRSFYPSPIGRIMFPVKNETPIDVASMFPELARFDLNQLPSFKTMPNGLDIRDTPSEIKPTTSELLEALSKVVLPHHDLPTPFAVQIGDDLLVLAEGDVVDNICTGYFAIFKKMNGSYRLRALLDLR